MDDSDDFLSDAVDFQELPRRNQDRVIDEKLDFLLQLFIHEILYQLDSQMIWRQVPYDVQHFINRMTLPLQILQSDDESSEDNGSL